MGAIGARIYEDDTALDIRGDFLEKYHAGERVEAIEQSVIDDYIEPNDQDYNDVVRLALCCVELETGTLTEIAKDAALEVIDSGRQKTLWLNDAGKTEAGLRSRELKLIKKYIDNYNGKPVRRKSWVELQRDSEEYEDPDPDNKLDDATWHFVDPDEKLDEEEYYDTAGAHIACFVYWLITRNYFNNTKIPLSVLEKVQKGTLSPSRFFEKYMDLKLFDTDAKEEVRDFVRAYYSGSEEAHYFKDYEDTLLNKRGLYTFRPLQPDLEKMARYIDVRYKEYQANPYGLEYTNKFSWRLLPVRFWLLLLASISCFFVAGVCFYYLVSKV